MYYMLGHYSPCAHWTLDFCQLEGTHLPSYADNRWETQYVVSRKCFEGRDGFVQLDKITQFTR
jgi:hypothetical protein